MIDFSPLIEALKESYATDREIEERLEISPGTLSRIRHGGSMPRLSVLYKLGELLNIPVERIMAYRDEEGNTPSDIDIKYLSSPAIIAKAPPKPPKPTVLKEPDFTSDVLVFTSKFQEKYKMMPSDYQDYLEFMGRAYKQGCRDTFRKMAHEIESKM